MRENNTNRFFKNFEGTRRGTFKKKWLERCRGPKAKQRGQDTPILLRFMKENTTHQKTNSTMVTISRRRECRLQPKLSFARPGLLLGTDVTCHLSNVVIYSAFCLDVAT